MIRLRTRWAVLLTPVLALVSSIPASAQEYFGRNKVQYEKFDWKILKSDHFDNFFYPPESLIVHDAARMAERWYCAPLGHVPPRVRPQVADLLRRSSGLRADERRRRTARRRHGRRHRIESDARDHAVHRHLRGQRSRARPRARARLSIQHRRGNAGRRIDAPRRAARSGSSKAWPSTSRSAAKIRSPRCGCATRCMRNKFPTIKQLTTDPRFFPYRYGQALWAYVGGRWGDRAIVDVYRTALRLGWDAGARCACSARTATRCRRTGPRRTARCTCRRSPGAQHPDSVGTKLVGLARSGDYNLAPTISPDGKLFAFFSSRNLFSIDLFDRRRDHRARSSRSSAVRRAIRTSTQSASSTRRAIGRPTAVSSRSSSTRTATTRSRSSTREVDERRAAHQAAGHRLGEPRVVVAGRQDARVLRTGRRHQRSLSARSREGHDSPADERPLRRHPADVVARRQDDRVRDGSRTADGFQYAQVLAAAARDVRPGDGPHQRVLAVRARASTSIRSSRPTARTCSSSRTRTASPTSTA